MTFKLILDFFYFQEVEKDKGTSVNISQTLSSPLVARMLDFEAPITSFVATITPLERLETSVVGSLISHETASLSSSSTTTIPEPLSS